MIKNLIGDIIELNISMKILQAYFLVALAISSLDLLFLLLGELGEINSSYLFIDALKYCIQIMPYRIYDMSAYFCLVGTLIGLGALIDQGEIMASRVLGKSFFQIILASFRPVLIIVLVGLISSELWIPQLSQKAEEERAIARDGTNLDTGYWINKERQFIHISSIPNEQFLEGITIYDLNDNYQLKEIIKADSASYINNIWQLKNINFDNHESPNYDLVNRKGEWKVGPQEFELKPILSHRYLSISELRERLEVEKIKSKRNQASLEFWKKLLQPISTFSLLLLAASLLFGPMRENKSGLRLIMGISIALGLDLLQKLFGSMSLVTDLTAFWAIFTPILFILIISSFSLKRL
ncbi:MAG: LptF/LptG family permease [SAR86 cluster bacterium]|nr:LptF/LptG family permease [SAR86 cluster bacterium]